MPRFIFQMDPHSKLRFETDSTIALIVASIRKNVDTYYYLRRDLFYHEDNIKALAKKLYLEDNKIVEENEEVVELENFDVVFLRDEPPFDMSYITATYLLERLPKSVRVINNPQSVRNFPEKISALNYKKYMVATCISQNFEIIKEFFNKNKVVVLKPLHSFGGRDISMIDSKTKLLSCFKELVANYPNIPVVVQKFIPNVKKGDKRVLLFDGEIIGAINRVPPEGGYISNLVAGGTAERTELSDLEIKISSEIAKDLKEQGIIFAGLDLIDGYLSEINVTCPTGIMSVNKIYNLPAEKMLESMMIEKILSQI